MSKVEERLAAMSLTLPTVPTPLGNYVVAKTVGNLVYLSGSGPRKPDDSYIVGKVPSVCSEEDAYAAAQLAGLNILASLKAEIGDLDRVRQVVKVLGMVNADPSFANHPKIINGFSDLMVEAFGDPGRAARSAVGMGSLPGNIPVEVEMIVEIE
ncbi:MAG TPA: RidA family protein [Gammaproteobacteria bacterium]|nr:RidA family protein [Gammaproteobacteria bacterium]